MYLKLEKNQQRVADMQTLPRVCEQQGVEACLRHPDIDKLQKPDKLPEMPKTSSRVRSDIAVSLQANILLEDWFHGMYMFELNSPGRGGGLSFASNYSDCATDTSGPDPGEENEGEL